MLHGVFFTSVVLESPGLETKEMYQRSTADQVEAHPEKTITRNPKALQNEPYFSMVINAEIRATATSTAKAGGPTCSTLPKAIRV